MQIAFLYLKIKVLNGGGDSFFTKKYSVIIAWVVTIDGYRCVEAEVWRV